MGLATFVYNRKLRGMNTMRKVSLLKKAWLKDNAVFCFVYIFWPWQQGGKTVTSWPQREMHGMLSQSHDVFSLVCVSNFPNKRRANETAEEAAQRTNQWVAFIGLWLLFVSGGALFLVKVDHTALDRKLLDFSTIP